MFAVRALPAIARFLRQARPSAMVTCFEGDTDAPTSAGMRSRFEVASPVSARRLFRLVARRRRSRPSPDAETPDVSAPRSRRSSGKRHRGNAFARAALEGALDPIAGGGRIEVTSQLTAGRTASNRFLPSATVELFAQYGSERARQPASAWIVSRLVERARLGLRIEPPSLRLSCWDCTGISPATVDRCLSGRRPLRVARRRGRCASSSPPADRRGGACGSRCRARRRTLST
jgi:hypothetical protein